MVLTNQDLLDLEHKLEPAFQKRNADGLEVLGFGETGVAIAWPPGEGAQVAKRLIAVPTREGVDHAEALLTRYINQVSPFVAVAPTDLRVITNDAGWFVPYLIQPLYAPDQLLERVLAQTEPDSVHPAVQALCNAVVAACEDRRQAIDAQFNNFAWFDGRLTLFDVGTPFLYDEQGRSELDLGEMMRVMPAVLRPLGRRKISAVIESMGSRRDSFRQAAMSLVRSDLGNWLPAALEAFNPYLDRPLSADEVHQRVIDLHRESKGVKNLMRLERWWSTKVRRRPYDMFITDSFTGELL